MLLFQEFVTIAVIIIECAHAFGKHNHCSLTYILLLFFIIFAPLRISQYLDYIDNALSKYLSWS